MGNPQLQNWFLKIDVIPIKQVLRIMLTEYFKLYIRKSLTFIFNKSLQQGIVPDILAISKVTPIDKEREMTDPNKFRPISTLWTFTQIFEKIIRRQLISYIEKQKIFCQLQMIWL